MSLPLALTLALLIDAAFGEPKWIWDRLPHPAVLMGRLVGVLDTALNSGSARKARGVLALLALVLSALLAAVVLQAFGWLAEVIAAASLLAHRSLVDHVRAVGDALRLSEHDARLAVGRIVGRDTTAMDGPAISRAAIESAAENFSDGVIAPAFWFLIAGLPGLLLCKMVNTADSMIGYRTERYEQFGWAAARFDDLLNWVPARLTALLVAGTHGVLHRWPRISRDARLHRSPNAGWPEAATALALDIALSGPRAYHGRMQDFPFVNATGRKDIGADDIDAACALLWRGWCATLFIALGLALFQS